MVLLQPLEPREELPQARDHDQEEPLQQLAEEEEDDGPTPNRRAFSCCDCC